MEETEQKNETDTNFEDLPIRHQEAIIDLLVSIIRNTDQTGSGDDRDSEKK